MPQEQEQEQGHDVFYLYLSAAKEPMLPLIELNQRGYIDIMQEQEQEQRQEQEQGSTLHLPLCPNCQGTSLAVCTPLYTLFIIHILHSFYFAYIHLLLFGYYLNLSCSQKINSLISLLLEPPCVREHLVQLKESHWKT